MGHQASSQSGLGMGYKLCSSSKDSPKTETGGTAKLELELIQPHMAQRPVLRGESGGACVARAVSVERGGMG